MSLNLEETLWREEADVWEWKWVIHIIKKTEDEEKVSHTENNAPLSG